MRNSTASLRRPRAFNASVADELIVFVGRGWQRLLGAVARNGWALFVLAAFGFVYSAALRFRFIEGDDAATIAFHALGRRPDVQPPYSVYHAGTDLMLSWLSVSEPVLRVVAIALSAAAAPVAVVLCLSLVFGWLASSEPTLEPSHGSQGRILLAGVLLLSIPEVFYLGLVFTPAVIGFCFILLAHILVRQALGPLGGSTPRRSAGLLAAGLLFGVGTACRFDLGLYGLFILLDAVLIQQAPLKLRFFRALRVAAVGLVGSSVCAGILWVAGIELEEVLALGTVTGSLAGEKADSGAYLTSLVLAGQPLYTPALVMLVTIGLWAARRRVRAFVLVNLVVLFGLVVVLRWHVPKTHLVVLPALLLGAAQGFLFLRKPWGSNPGLQRLLVLGLAGILLLPWLGGGADRARGFLLGT